MTRARATGVRLLSRVTVPAIEARWAFSGWSFGVGAGRADRSGEQVPALMSNVAVMIATAAARTRIRIS